MYEFAPNYNKRQSLNFGEPAFVNGQAVYDDWPYEPPRFEPDDFAMTPHGLIGRKLPSEYPAFFDPKKVGIFFTDFFGGKEHLAAHGVTVLLENPHYWYGEFYGRKSTRGFSRRVLCRLTSTDGVSRDANTRFELAGYRRARETGLWVFCKGYRCPTTGVDAFRCLHALTNVSLAPSVF